MKLLLLLALLAVVAFGFRPIPMGTMVQKRLMQLSAMDIVGRDISVTDPLRNRVQGKIGKVMDKLGRDVISTNVVLRVHRFPDTGICKLIDNNTTSVIPILKYFL